MSERSLAGRRVLVVEDEYMIAAVLAEDLGAEGAVVVGPAPSIPAALALLEDAGHLDLAVLDANLRGEDVYPVADVLADRRVPFVLVTGYDRHAIPERYRAGPVLEKPVEITTVLGALRDLLD